MTRTWRTISLILSASMAWAAAGAAQPLTVEKAVQMALARSSQMILADASVLDARSGLYGAYSGMLPRFSADYSRAGSLDAKQRGTRVFGGVPFAINTNDVETYSTTPTLSGSWSVLDLSALSGWSSARSDLRAAQLSRKTARQAVALDARVKFYDVVKAIHLAHVSTDALRLSRDSERRVRALFDVGSVSR